MKNIFVLILGLLVGAGGVWIFSRHGHEEKAESEAAHEAGAHAEGGVIKLDKKQQAAAGIEVAQPQPAHLPWEIKGFGRALDPTPLVTTALDVQAARAALEASTKDFERVKALFAQNQNTSARALETAEATVKRDRALLSVAEAKLQTTLGPDLSGRDNLAELFDALAKMKWTLLRIDLPFGGAETPASKVRVAALVNESASFEAELLGPAPLAETSIQGRGFLVLLKTNSLPPNTAVVAWFEIAGHERDGFLVQAKSILQEGPETIVFIQTAEDTFKKVEVEVDRDTGEGAFITRGLAATNRVVVSGAHQILSVTKAEPAD